MENSSKSEQIREVLEHIDDLSRRRNLLRLLIQEQKNNLNTIKLREGRDNFLVSAIRIDDGDSYLHIQFNPHVKGMDMSLVKDIVSGMIKEMETKLDGIEQEIERYLKF